MIILYEFIYKKIHSDKFIHCINKKSIIERNGQNVLNDNLNNLMNSLNKRNQV